MSEKWTLYAWPDDQPEPILSNGYLFRREYRSPTSARRAASQVHRRFPDAWIEIQCFQSTGDLWAAQGERKAMLWCPSCGSPMEWPDCRWWGCPHCNDSWEDAIGPIFEAWNIDPTEVTITRRDAGQSRTREGWSRLTGTFTDGSDARVLFICDEGRGSPLIDAAMRNGVVPTIVPQDDDTILDIYVPLRCSSSVELQRRDERCACRLPATTQPIPRCELMAARSFAVVGAGHRPVASFQRRSRPTALLYLSAVRPSAPSSCGTVPSPVPHVPHCPALVSSPMGH